MNNRNPTNYKTIIQPTCNDGFTLLELLVVIVIAGIMFSFLALSFRSKSPEEAIKEEALRLNQLIQIAMDEAVLRGEEYALVVKSNNYQFAHLTEQGWQYITDDRLLRKRDLPNEIALNLEIENNQIPLNLQKPKIIEDESISLESKKISISTNQEEIKKEKIEPQIYLLSSGEITPEFTLSMQIFGVTTEYQIIGKANGQHSTNSYVY